MASCAFVFEFSPSELWFSCPWVPWDVISIVIRPLSENSVHLVSAGKNPFRIIRHLPNDQSEGERSNTDDDDDGACGPNGGDEVQTEKHVFFHVRQNVFVSLMVSCSETTVFDGTQSCMSVFSHLDRENPIRFQLAYLLRSTSEENDDCKRHNVFRDHGLRRILLHDRKMEDVRRAMFQTFSKTVQIREKLRKLFQPAFPTAVDDEKIVDGRNHQIDDIGKSDELLFIAACNSFLESKLSEKLTRKQHVIEFCQLVTQNSVQDHSLSEFFDLTVRRILSVSHNYRFCNSNTKLEYEIKHANISVEKFISYPDEEWLLVIDHRENELNGSVFSQPVESRKANSTKQKFVSRRKRRSEDDALFRDFEVEFTFCSNDRNVSSGHCLNADDDDKDQNEEIEESASSHFTSRIKRGICPKNNSISFQKALSNTEMFFPNFLSARFVNVDEDIPSILCCDVFRKGREFDDILPHKHVVFSTYLFHLRFACALEFLEHFDGFLSRSIFSNQTAVLLRRPIQRCFPNGAIGSNEAMGGSCDRGENELKGSKKFDVVANGANNFGCGRATDISSRRKTVGWQRWKRCKKPNARKRRNSVDFILEMLMEKHRTTATEFSEKTNDDRSWKTSCRNFIPPMCEDVDLLFLNDGSFVFGFQLDDFFFPEGEEDDDSSMSSTSSSSSFENRGFSEEIRSPNCIVKKRGHEKQRPPERGSCFFRSKRLLRRRGMNYFKNVSRLTTTSLSLNVNPITNVELEEDDIDMIQSFGSLMNENHHCSDLIYDKNDIFWIVAQISKSVLSGTNQRRLFSLKPSSFHSCRQHIDEFHRISGSIFRKLLTLLDLD